MKNNIRKAAPTRNPNSSSLLRGQGYSSTVGIAFQPPTLCWFCFRNPIPLASPVPCPWHFAACFIYLFLTINFIKFKLLRQEKCYLTSKVLFYLSFWCWITKALFLISAFSDQRNRSRDNSDCD